MSSWTTPADLRAQLQRRWDRGELLADPPAFPLQLNLRAPSSSELLDRFDAVRDWAAALQQGQDSGYRLVMRDLRHRVLGANRLPAQAWVDTREDALRLLGQRRAAQVYAGLVATTQQRQPALLPWLQRHPHRALALADAWPQLLGLVAWLQAHPRPGIYLRQVDLPGVHTKFIEAQRAVLAELLDLALPPEAIDAQASGAAGFARRYGFADKPLRVRLRFLDPQQRGWVPGGDGDYTLSHPAFATLDPAEQQVFVTENEVNFLALPPLPGSLVVFGAGYGFDALAAAGWLQQRRVRYWGDIDTHGFAILDQLRVHVPQAQSFLMDEPTLMAHRDQWVPEPQPTQRDLPRLTDAERRLYDDLRWCRLGDAPVRLEQERIGFGWVQQAVAALAAAPA